MPISKTYVDNVLVNNTIARKSDIKTFFPKDILEGDRVTGNWQERHKSVLSRDPRPGDVLIVGENSTGFDVAVFVRWAADGAGRRERNGLILVQAKCQYGQTGQRGRQRLNMENLQKTIDGCSKLRGTIFGTGWGKRRAAWLGGFGVAEEDVLIALATHFPADLTDSDMAGALGTCKFSIAFGKLDDDKPGSGISAFFGKTLASRAFIRSGFVQEK